MATNSGNKVLLGLIIIGVLIAGSIVVAFSGIKFQTFQLGGTGSNNNQNVKSDCQIAPSVVSTVTDSLQPGTAVTTTNYYRINGVYTGSTAPTFAGTAEVLVTNASYLSAIVPNVAVGCGPNQLVTSMAKFAAPAITVYSNNGLLALTNKSISGTYNDTNAGLGGTLTWKYHLQSAALKSSGQMLLVVEVGAPTANVSTVSLSGGTPTSVPNGYTRQVSGSYATAFLLPAVSNGQAVDYFLSATAVNNAMIYNSAVYSTLYSLEPFVQTDGTFNPGDAAFDSQNAAKYHAAQTFTWYIV